MKKYSAIVFDLGNVILPFDYNPFISKLNKIKPDLGDRFKENYKNNYHIHRAFESGKLNTSGFLKLMMGWTDNMLSEEEFCVSYSSIFSVDEKVAGLLPLLKEKYKLILLSNTNPVHKKYGWEQYDFLKYFDKQILSHEAGSVKPEEKIYNAVMEFTQLAPGEHFYIDDIPEYAVAAKKLGWGAVQFTNYEALLEELIKEKIL